MNVAFEKECGFFDPDIPNGGPPPQLRKRRDIQRQLVGFEVEERLLMKRDAEQEMVKFSPQKLAGFKGKIKYILAYRTISDMCNISPVSYTMSIFHRS